MENALMLIQRYFSYTTSESISLFAIKVIGYVSKEIHKFPEFLDFVATSSNFQALEPNAQKLILQQISKKAESKLSPQSQNKDLEARLAPKFISTIRFIINNLTLLNFKSKLAEFDSLIKKNISSADEDKDLFENDCLIWVAYYIVCMRSAEEPDCQKLYIELIEKSEYASFLKKLIYKECIKYTRELLMFNRSLFDSVQSRRLMNLGEFLCHITLLKNIPIMQDDLPLDLLLCESALKSLREVEIVVHYTCKILLLVIMSITQSSLVSCLSNSLEGNDVFLEFFTKKT